MYIVLYSISGCIWHVCVTCGAVPAPAPPPDAMAAALSLPRGARSAPKWAEPRSAR